MLNVVESVTRKVKKRSPSKNYMKQRLLLIRANRVETNNCI